ncbi:MAG TPA: hypothetical protein VHW23_00455 [Kofleriaceae bacterium]|jgi:hypothetical protein|nr:hypothetical protein [Kofleriaceae bacterium]
MRFASLACIAAASACGSTSHAGYVVVTIDARPAVHGATSVTVTLANAGTSRTDTLTLRGTSFPVTFSVSAPGRTGDLAITVDATDATGQVIGHGSAMTMVDAAKAEVMLDSTDFVVNTDYTGDQFPTDDFQASGFQLAALPDGTWTTVFRDGCPQGPCDVFARRFDRAGTPVATQAAMGSNAFVVTAKPTTSVTTPAIASSRDATVVVWNASDPTTATATGVVCRPIDAGGQLAPDQTTIAPEAGFVVSVAAMDGGNFAATWRTTIPPPAADNVDAIHMVVIKPDCTPVGSVVEFEEGARFADFVHRGSVASGGGQTLFAWITNGDLHTTLMASDGTRTPVTPLIPQTATLEVEHARVAAVPGGGFVIAVSWTLKTGTGPGRIDLVRVDTHGALVGSPVTITDQSDGDPFNAESFGLASRPDGSILIVWHVCNATGDSCALSGRFLQLPADASTAPAPVSDTFAIPTTTGGSDKRASVIGLPDAFAVVWSDSSARPPDTSGQAVRARILYPPGAD